MVDLLAGDPVLLAFLVIGLGAGVGAIHARGVALGPAAALFVGLAIGAIDESLSGAPGLALLRELGLVLFTYTIGLASGPTFVNGVRRGGVAAIAVTVALVAGLAVLCAGVAGVLDLAPAERAGLFAGSTTNTPALQAASEAVASGDPVVAYSLAYPAAVVTMLVMVTLVLGRRVHLPATLEPPRTPQRSDGIVNLTIEVTADELPTLGDLRARYPGIGFSRVERDGVVEVDLPHHYGVIPTRVRRGDTDLVATDDFELELGDRVRVVGPTDRLAQVARLLGDSERRLAEVDALGFALGVTAGVALGTVTVHVGSIDLEFGAGGGPLVVGLALGVISRTGPITWQIPHGANQVLRQLGILMFLACAGLGSGTAFADAVVTREGVELALAGAVVAGGFAAMVPLVLAVVVRREAVATAGMLAGIETQPAALAYGTERTGGDDRISRAYALVFPAAMLAKVVAVQLLV